MNAPAVLEFWFGAADAARAEWFRKDDAFDARIRERFGDTIEAALDGALLEWTADAGGALARILLLDQFTRNVFRGTPRAFAGDVLALAAAREMVARGQDMALAPLRRLFTYLPFEHAEDRDAQQQAVRLIGALGLADFTGYAQRHAAVIERFGRFPHRNAILGRTSTGEEIEFLKQPGSSF